ncbi:hydantoinase B/oxoprolinase family protein [Mesorhizobium sp. M1D.F.Ca.ET.184.01.1.1]|nr:hydantoinase B/oxoprolinase family protein [Mesorhizobium sp. M1D.F.Ca.ET.231.01.1.1]TGP25483.1 hydantoinase B/oxoprolinase family protein [Mesorhizobium sp. M1D.F.Ca.ET.234.01.1.1]TGS38369.1 hydantoinase B/oxoprolinase family protein [Mesorhizobium sp. M1D.F.Ca.ET.184.01.1.1]TGS58376.1 hydantoinase B/oxoprolinase family protein [Mesorhizobium sp. M1D.F.Ca.ET.183.01.1.1]
MSEAALREKKIPIPVSVDPVTLTVVEKGLQQVCTEMDLVHEKTSFSPIIAEAYDRANGIYHRQDGRMIAQGELGLPIFLGQLAVTTSSVIKMRDDLQDGDVIVVNDPYIGGSHLMDVRMVRPFFYKGRLWAYLSNVGHWRDTGGVVPGGFTTRSTEIHQEGLRIPPVKLVRQGKIEADILQFILNNIRVPSDSLGDVKAQIAALGAGARRLTALLDRYGEDVVDSAVAELELRSERLMRSHIETIPDGSYKGVAFVDSDGVVNEPLEIRASVTVSDSDIHVDFEGSSAPCEGPMNTVWATTLSAVYIALKHIFPDVPMNAGCFRPIGVTPPHGTFLYAEYPKATAGSAAEVSQRIIESILLALAPAIPDKIFAAPAGTSGNLSLGGIDPDTGESYVMYNFSGGGYGGWWAGDGISNGCATIGISKSQPVEVLELRHPVLFEHYALREGSAGSGKYRGGLGVSYRMKLLRGTGTASFLMDHGRQGPPGTLGGKAGAPNEIAISRGGKVEIPEHLSKGEGYVLRPGDWIDVKTPGGGGYGDPLDRDPSRLERDRKNGY